MSYSGWREEEAEPVGPGDSLSNLVAGAGQRRGLPSGPAH